MAIEGTNSYGSTLTRALHVTDLDVCEVRPPRRTSRVGRDKSDDIDALAAAHPVLSEQVSALLTPRAEGSRGALRILLKAREAMEHQATSDRLILNALVRTVDLGIDARKALADTQVREIGRGRIHSSYDLQSRIARSEAKRLAVATQQFQISWQGTRKNCSRSWWRWLWTCWISLGCGRRLPRKSSSPTSTMVEFDPKQPSPLWPGSTRFRRPQATTSGTGSTFMEIDNSKGPCTQSPVHGWC